MTIQLGTFKIPKDSHLVILRSDEPIPRKKFLEYRSKIRRGNKHWDGILLHLKLNQRIEALSPTLLETVYESLLSKFDPDLHSIRMDRKAKALAEQRAIEQRAAESTVDRLAAAKAAGEKERLQGQVEAAKRLDAAKQAGETHVE